MRVRGFIDKAVVIQETDLVAHVEERHAAERGDQRVAHQDPVDGKGDGFPVAGFERVLKAGKAGAGKVTFVNIQTFNLETLKTAEPWSVGITVK